MTHSSRWWGEVPSAWSKRRFKTVFVERDERSVSGDETLMSVSAYTGVSPRADIIAEGDHLTRASSLHGYKVCYPDDLVMNIMLAWNRGLGFAQQMGIVSPAYSVFRLTEGNSPRFMDYLVRSDYAIKYFKAFSAGVIDSRLRLYPDTFGQLHCYLPPLPEQAAIAAFLDRETGKIDALVEQQKRLIELLKEKRQAVISHAVTKGLDPNVPMKPSGVEWLGDVPEYWSAVQLGRLCRKVSDGPHFSPNYHDEGVLFLSARNIKVDGWALDDAKFISEEDYHEFCRRIVPEVGDVLYTKGGTTGIARAVDLTEPFQVWVHVAVLKLRRELIDPHFLAYALNSPGCYEQSQLHTRGATNQDLGLTRMIKIWLTLPPLSEQVAIRQHLDHVITRFDALVVDAERCIALLRERRAALISAAVTGKIDVRPPMEVQPIGTETARLLVAAAAIDLLAHKRTFGRVKLQKLAYLAEAHAGLAELKGTYLREAAGPLDRQMIGDMEKLLDLAGQAKTHQPDGAGTQVTYELIGERDRYRREAEEVFGDRWQEYERLLLELGELDTKSAEAVATLFGVWNDLLIDGLQPDDEAVITEVLSNWHPEKSKKFRRDELDVWLGWMRRHQFIPRGTGPRTEVGRLFA